VYLMGIARTPAELQRVIDHVRDVPYVRAVVSHVRVRTDPLPPIPDQIPVIPPATPPITTGTTTAATASAQGGGNAGAIAAKPIAPKTIAP
jgi:hypothetical protein